MLIKSINRKYENLNFVLKNKLDNEYYEKLLEDEKYYEMKDIAIPHFENKLHVIASYIFTFKYILPILMLFLFIILNLHYVFYVSIIIPLIIYYIFRKKWKLSTTIYCLEITAINNLINEKYGINIETDFNEISN